jgi:HAD superfamily hydrolase (TIGR01458 family)
MSGRHRSGAVLTWRTPRGTARHSQLTGRAYSMVRPMRTVPSDALIRKVVHMVVPFVSDPGPGGDLPARRSTAVGVNSTTGPYASQFLRRMFPYDEAFASRALITLSRSIVPPMHRRGLLVDIDGVLTVSWKPLPGVGDALRRLREADISMVFVTNTTSATHSSIATKLQRAGLAIDVNEILTAASTTAALIHRDHLGARCWMVGDTDVAADLDEVNLVGVDESPEVVVLGGAGPEFDYPTLNRIFRMAMDGTPVIAMHRNLYWMTKDGLQLDTGAFVGVIEQAAGIEVSVTGKPSRACFESALEMLDLAPEEVAMVGDDLYTDVLGAQAMGIEGVLVRTGKFREETLAGSGLSPDHVVDSFADLPALLVL